MSLAKRIKDLRYQLFYSALRRGGVPLMELGNRETGCNWRFCPLHLKSDSIIYSAGVGNDITFEHGLVKQFGCNVVLMDPSPTGTETMQKPENRIPAFQFYPVALADKSGILELAPPMNAVEGSWFAQASTSGGIRVEARDLESLMKQNGHTHVDLLKIDIEGAEYGVLRDIIRRKLPVHQIAVEFHHGILPGVRRSDTIRSVISLTAAGHRLIDINGSNQTFLQRKFLP